MKLTKKGGTNIFIKKITRNCTNVQRKLQGLKGYSNNYESHNLVKGFLKISQVSQKTPVLESFFNKAAYTGVFLWNWKSCFMNGFIYRTPPVAASWYLQQSSVIFSVITINLAYNQKSSWKYCNYFHLCFCKNIHLLSKDPVMTLSSI